MGCGASKLNGCGSAGNAVSPGAKPPEHAPKPPEHAPKPDTNADIEAAFHAATSTARRPSSSLSNDFGGTPIASRVLENAVDNGAATAPVKSSEAAKEAPIFKVRDPTPSEVVTDSHAATKQSDEPAKGLVENGADAAHAAPPVTLIHVEGDKSPVNESNGSLNSAPPPASPKTLEPIKNLEAVKPLEPLPDLKKAPLPPTPTSLEQTDEEREAENRAATTVQAHVRGYNARKAHSKRLLEAEAASKRNEDADELPEAAADMEPEVTTLTASRKAVVNDEEADEIDEDYADEIEDVADGSEKPPPAESEKPHATPDSNTTAGSVAHTSEDLEAVMDASEKPDAGKHPKKEEEAHAEGNSKNGHASEALSMSEQHGHADDEQGIAPQESKAQHVEASPPEEGEHATANDAHQAALALPAAGAAAHAVESGKADFENAAADESLDHNASEKTVAEEVGGITDASVKEDSHPGQAAANEAVAIDTSVKPAAEEVSAVGGADAPASTEAPAAAADPAGAEVLKAEEVSEPAETAGPGSAAKNELVLSAANAAADVHEPAAKGDAGSAAKNELSSSAAKAAEDAHEPSEGAPAPEVKDMAALPEQGTEKAAAAKQDDVEVPLEGDNAHAAADVKKEHNAELASSEPASGAGEAKEQPAPEGGAHAAEGQVEAHVHAKDSKADAHGSQTAVDKEGPAHVDLAGDSHAEEAGAESEKHSAGGEKATDEHKLVHGSGGHEPELGAEEAALKGESQKSGDGQGDSAAAEEAKDVANHAPDLPQSKEENAASVPAADGHAEEHQEVEKEHDAIESHTDSHTVAAAEDPGHAGAQGDESAKSAVDNAEVQASKGDNHESGGAVSKQGAEEPEGVEANAADALTAAQKSGTGADEASATEEASKEHSAEEPVVQQSAAREDVVDTEPAFDKTNSDGAPAQEAAAEDEVPAHDAAVVEEEHAGEDAATRETPTHEPVDDNADATKI